MSNCNCAPCGSTQNFTQRSNTATISSDKDLSNFLLSADYDAYLANFTVGIIDGQQRLITFNNTTIQGLWLPTIDTASEKQVLFTFYKLGTTDYLTFVVKSNGVFTDLLNMHGDWNLWTVNRANLLAAKFEASEWISQSYGTGLTYQERSIAQCITQTINSMGLGTTIACAFDPEACLLAIAIDCAWEHLMA